MFIRSSSTITDIALTVPNLTGGTNGRVVRISGTNIATTALNTDSAVQLNAVLLKQNDIFYAGGVVSGFTNLSAGSPYFLAADGTITSTAPVPTSTTRVLYLGFALNSTDLLFRPGTPISGT